MKAPWDDADVEFPVTVRIHYTLYHEDIDELTDEYEDVEAWAGLSEYDSSDDARDYLIGCYGRCDCVEVFDYEAINS